MPQSISWSATTCPALMQALFTESSIPSWGTGAITSYKFDKSILHSKEEKATTKKIPTPSWLTCIGKAAVLDDR